MRKTVCFVISILFLLVLLAAGKSSFSWQCVGPEDSNCLQCHLRGDIHNYHIVGLGFDDCSVCHCGVNCEPNSEGPVDAFCCADCHDECFEISEHTSNLRYDCASCHYTFDADGDGAADCLDNCPEAPNDSLLGTCAKTYGTITKGTGVTCNGPEDCGSGEICQKDQEDCNLNGPGDACECYADFNGDGLVYPSDLSVFLNEYGRTDCITNPPCQADMDGDGNVYPSDLSIFLAEYGREDCPEVSP